MHQVENPENHTVDMMYERKCLEQGELPWPGRRCRARAPKFKHVREARGLYFFEILSLERRFLLSFFCSSQPRVSPYSPFRKLHIAIIIVAMATPFESTDGLTWADQWDYKSEAATRGQQQQQQQQQSKLADYNKKIKSAASTGLDKAKVAASAGSKKVKSGTASGFQWIKDQYHKKTQK